MGVVCVPVTWCCNRTLGSQRRIRGSPIPAAKDGDSSHSALLLADISTGVDIGRTPLMLGLLSYLQRHLTAGFFLPIGRVPPGNANSTSTVDRHVELCVMASAAAAVTFHSSETLQHGQHFVTLAYLACLLLRRMIRACNLKDDPNTMIGVTEEEAHKVRPATMLAGAWGRRRDF